MVQLQTETRNFKFKTDGENPKDFILSFNGESYAVNTKSGFIDTDELAKALNEAKKAVKAGK